MVPLLRPLMLMEFWGLIFLVKLELAVISIITGSSSISTQTFTPASPHPKENRALEGIRHTGLSVVEPVCSPFPTGCS